MADEKEIRDESILRSEEIDEVIGRPPHWLVQWGITVFLVILLLVLTISYFIEYPETVSVPFTITADVPPSPVSVNQNGQLMSLAVSEAKVVHKNDTLFWWRENGAKAGQFVLAPADGKIAFVGPLVNGQPLTKGATLFFIIPASKSYYATTWCGAADAEKLKPGQHVILDLSQFPRADYGFINGSIDYISPVSAAKGTYVKIVLSNGLKSDINKTIPFKDGLNGTAEVIISKKRLMYKLIGKIKI
jgi:hypothetical protein